MAVQNLTEADAANSATTDPANSAATTTRSLENKPADDHTRKSGWICCGPVRHTVAVTWKIQMPKYNTCIDYLTDAAKHISTIYAVAALILLAVAIYQIQAGHGSAAVQCLTLAKCLLFLLNAAWVRFTVTPRSSQKRNIFRAKLCCVLLVVAGVVALADLSSEVVEYTKCKHETLDAASASIKLAAPATSCSATCLEGLVALENAGMAAKGGGGAGSGTRLLRKLAVGGLLRGFLSRADSSSSSSSSPAPAAVTLSSTPVTAASPAPATATAAPPPAPAAGGLDSPNLSRAARLKMLKLVPLVETTTNSCKANLEAQGYTPPSFVSSSSSFSRVANLRNAAAAQAAIPQLTELGVKCKAQARQFKCDLQAGLLAFYWVIEVLILWKEILLFLVMRKWAECHKLHKSELQVGVRIINAEVGRLPSLSNEPI